MNKKKLIIIAASAVTLLAIGISIYLVFFANKNITISFDSNGGEKVASIKVKANSTITLPALNKDGYNFTGWYQGKTMVTNETKYKSNTTLVAKWEKIPDNIKTFKITFDSNGGSEVSNLTLECDKEIKLPTNPTKKGYTFIAWKDKNEVPIGNGALLTCDDITLYANWKKNDSTEEPVEKPTEKPSQDIPVSSIDFSKEKVEMIVNTTNKLDVTFSPSNATNKKIVSWESDNKNVITVDNSGNIRATGLGSALITAKTANGKKATIRVYSKVKSVSITAEREYISKYGITSTTLTAVIDANGYNVPASMVSWSVPDATGYNAAAGTNNISDKKITITSRDCWSTSYCGVNVKLIVGSNGYDVTSEKKVFVLPKLEVSSTPRLTDNTTSITVANNSTLNFNANIDVTWEAMSSLITNKTDTSKVLTLGVKNTRSHPEGFTVKATAKDGQTVTYSVTVRTT